jgi:hypothetical protein
MITGTCRESDRRAEEQGMTLIPFIALDGAQAQLDTTDSRTDFVCEPDDAGKQSYKVNGVPVSEETYEHVLSQVMGSWDKIQRGE